MSKSSKIMESLLEFNECQSNFGHSFVSFSDMDIDKPILASLNIASNWNSADYRANVHAGTQIAFYELDMELGSGKFSKVKQGRHIISGNNVAVKIIEKTRVTEQRQHIFQRELKILEKPHHPNIIRLYEYIITLNQIYVVTELANGLNVQKWVQQKGSLSEPDTLFIFAQLVAAVDHLHSMFIAHRDIKGDNLVFDPSTGIVKLIDFGFACYSQEGSTSTTFCGSLPFAAPELFQTKPYDAKAVDLWAMGVLLYYMRSGQLPYGGLTAVELKNNIRRGEYVVPRSFSDNFVKLLGGLMHLEPTRRMTIKRVMRSSLFLDTKFQRQSLEITTNRAHPEPRCQRLVHETLKYLVDEYSINAEKLIEALNMGGLHDPLMGLYRIKYMELCKEYYEPKIMLPCERITLESKIKKMKEERKIKERHKAMTRICNIL